jgi:hypothetical protein
MVDKKAALDETEAKNERENGMRPHRIAKVNSGYGRLLQK